MDPTTTTTTPDDDDAQAESLNSATPDIGNASSAEILATDDLRTTMTTSSTSTPAGTGDLHDDNATSAVVSSEEVMANIDNTDISVARAATSTFKNDPNAIGTSKVAVNPMLPDTSSTPATATASTALGKLSNNNNSIPVVECGGTLTADENGGLSPIQTVNGVDQNTTSRTTDDEIDNGESVVVKPHTASSTNASATATAVSLPPPPRPTPPPPPPRQPKTKSLPKNDKDVKQLELELASAKSMIESLRKQQQSDHHGDTNGDSSSSSTLLMELQQKLQQEMSDKAEAENKVRLAEQELQELRKLGQEQKKEFENYKDLEQALKTQVTARAEAENTASVALKRLAEVESQATKDKTLLEQLQRDLVAARDEMALQQQELDRIREQRNEQERKEIALTNRLNEAKKKEADKANLAEQFEEDFKNVQDELALAHTEIQDLRTIKAKLEHDLDVTRKNAAEKVHHAETALTDERRLNDDRKQKMKAFIEKKSEELRQAKMDNDSLQSEVNQTSKSLVDLNQRWKQLHAQWVQSQTRNRELQRDLNRIKKDSENLHKVGDTLEMKLSRSANETEEHKNKRLAAKHELMTVLRTLEAEREVTARLRDSIKFTFTPKALSQQQLLKESVEDFETQLLHLSRRLGKPLPPVTDADISESTTTEGMIEADHQTAAILETEASGNRTEVDAQRLISKLDHETQRVSHCIMAFTSGIERLHLLLDASGSRTCFTVFNELIASGGVVGSAVGDSQSRSTLREETTSMTGQATTRGLTSVRSHQYGQIAGASSSSRR